MHFWDYSFSSFLFQIKQPENSFYVTKFLCITFHPFFNNSFKLSGIGYFFTASKQTYPFGLLNWVVDNNRKINVRFPLMPIMLLSRLNKSQQGFYLKQHVSLNSLSDISFHFCVLLISHISESPYNCLQLKQLYTNRTIIHSDGMKISF